jgi:hypothetical protein
VAELRYARFQTVSVDSYFRHGEDSAMEIQSIIMYEPLQGLYLLQSDGPLLIVTLPRTVTPYREIMDRTRDHVWYQSWLRGNVTCLLGALSVFGRRIKGMIQLRPEQVWTCNVTRHHRSLLSPSLHS